MKKEEKSGVIAKENSFIKIRRYIFYVVVAGASFKMIKKLLKI